MIFEQAVAAPLFAPIYAHLCRCLSEALAPIRLQQASAGAGSSSTGSSGGAETAQPAMDGRVRSSDWGLRPPRPCP